MFRFFELLPGILSWTTLLGMIVVAWRAPVFASFFIILFDTYWLLKTIYLSFHLRSAFGRMREYMRTDWLERLEKEYPIRWNDVYHLVIFPMFQEPYEVVEESFLALKNANYPLERLIVVLAREKRARESKLVAERIAQRFGSSFFQFLVTVHPENLSGELPGKGSNETFAAREVKTKIIDGLNIPYEQILVSIFDVDTQILPEYFGILTHHFLSAPHPQRSSFQPVPLFTNNIYAAPALARVIAFSSSFWHMIQQARPERITTFSSHAMPFRALVEVGFWRTDIVSEDSQIFWQCFLHYHGDWRTVPIAYPVSMDANVAPGFFATLRNIYKQQRRWAWGGCENIPYMLNGFLKNSRIPLRAKLYWAFTYVEGFHSWATNSLLIFALGWLPIVLGDPLFRISVLSYTLPRIVRTIMLASMIGIVSSAFISMLLLPQKPLWFRGRHYVLYAVQWLLMPFTLIVFGALPALDAQTRALLGGRWRLDFWPTPKYRTKSADSV
ncbi:MAG: hypothetical protein G01um101466_753 [Parcubacteria group bacterium Gr01-1014_66]|nr:MAG: hypothetical protein G01um101466_753 [Parcubacteria group bacterium Gr01-1014_66]